MRNSLRLIPAFAVLAFAALTAAWFALRPGAWKSSAIVRFAYPNRIGMAIPILAVEKQLFPKHGVAVKVLSLNDGPACAEALFTGAADVASLGDGLTVTAVSRDDRLRLVASHVSGERRYRLMVKKTSPYKTIYDLAGKRIGVKKGTSIYAAFLKYCDANNISRDSFILTDIGLAMMPEALASGTIDAFAGSEPAPSLAERAGARELTTLAGLGNIYPAMLVTHERVLRDRKQDIENFVAALREAENIIEENPDAAAALLAGITGLPPDATKRIMERHSYKVRMDAEILESLHQTAEFLRDQGVIRTVSVLRTPD